jgi:hypothetical protein
MRSAFLGADPDFANFLSDSNSTIHYLVTPEDRKKFNLRLDLIRRRFGERVDPAEAYRWAVSNGMTHEPLKQALGRRAVLEPAIAKRPSRVASDQRQEDVTKPDISRSKLIAAVAASRKFRADAHNDAVGKFRTELSLAGHDLDNKTIRDVLIFATKHSETRKSFANFLAEERKRGR